MRVEITEVLEPDRRLIRFESDFGSADAVLCGQAPPDRRALDVEFDIPDEVVTWAVANQEEAAIAGQVNGCARLVGKIIGIDADDKIVNLRVGGDVFLVEFVDLPGEELIDSWVSVDVRQIHLYEVTM
ncbi:hypothetical protein [Amycolatopsis australiensis]|uniref:Uncharacterized protein n=1 Tax=Amycolatopsis australiensis TaxID=546364 RepID=A0A1K1QWA3_9PSEU|nr:hypothetical protein [Amycolatopsis australiensis]SFW64210.1 hypothetical protein SAMN04489730_2329 [Amycolatopsis australiensis]